MCFWFHAGLDKSRTFARDVLGILSFTHYRTSAFTNTPFQFREYVYLKTLRGYIL